VLAVAVPNFVHALIELLQLRDFQALPKKIQLEHLAGFEAEQDNVGCPVLVSSVKKPPEGRGGRLDGSLDIAEGRAKVISTPVERKSWVLRKKMALFAAGQGVT
jgi:hypothetical protein